ncbi:MAG TPA: SGNH/GDSL hydrolase family protein [Acidobacteriaceae bacterium]|nr:SGNH/GDSL hydrolase family protein [Acidobacteriaceae bacterium]
MRFRYSITFTLIFCLAAFAVLPCCAQNAPPAQHWVGTWASSQQIPEPANALPPDQFRDATLRQIVHLSVGGAELRLHLSNAFGTAPLRIDSVHIARPLSPSTDQIDGTTDKTLTFGGSSDVVIPAGAEYISDPVDYPVSALSNLAISLHLSDPPAQQTGHPGSRATSYVVHGNMVSAPTLPNATKIDHWYQIAGVDVTTPADPVSIVALGDSITDGHASTTNGNDRWTDDLAERLQGSPTTSQMGVLNQGIGGNHLLVDGLGPNALARFNRDVLAQTGVRYVIVLEGVNDLGGLTRLGEVPIAEHEALVAHILAAYQQMILRAHAHGIEIIGGTITPYAGSDYYHPTARDEQDRNAVNAWIRAPGHFDAVIDFDRVMQNPSHPDRLLPSYDSGDHLHPSPAGYRAMANAIPLSLFRQ